MEDLNKFLATIPIFSSLKSGEIKRLKAVFEEIVFEKGEVVCEMGDEGDTFYVVLSGELEVWGGEEGEERRTGTLRARDFFGEMALVLGGNRTATVKAARRSRLLALGKSSFEKFFLSNPKAVEYFARVLCKRLASVTKGETGQTDKMIISVGSHKALRGKTLIASALAGILFDLTKDATLLVLVRPQTGNSDPNVTQLLSDDLGKAPEKLKRQLSEAQRGPAVLEIDAKPGLAPSDYSERASNLIAKLGGLFRFIVFDLGSDVPGLIESVEYFSDVFVDLIDDPENPFRSPVDETTKFYQVINHTNPNSPRLSISHCEPFVLPEDPSLPSEDPSGYIRNNRRTPIARPLHRLARKILGASVGVALGGGAAFGISHLGVLKVLEDNDVPIDLVAGCSQGSIIGIGYSAGVSVDEMIGIARQLGKKRNFLKPVDLTFMGPGFLAGNRMIDIFAQYLNGHETFEDLVLPCRTIATDIESGERVAIGSGSLNLAFRASSAVPMVFAPLKLNGRALVDGGVADPVPAEVVREMGADMCIAVNVVPPLKKGVTTVLAKAYQQMNRFNPLSYLGTSQELPNMFDIVMNSMQVLQYELGNFKAISADVLINPDLSDFTWIEYYRSEELIERGIEAAESALPAIQKSLEDRVQT